MSTGGDAADQMVREGIEILESSVKLSALGAKNLAAIAIALAKDNPKMRGKTNLDRLLKDGKELQVFPLKQSDLKEFHQQAKQYGVLFAAIKEKNGEGELLDILARAEDVAKLNRIFERMGYAIPKEKKFERKNAATRYRYESALPIQRAGSEKTNQEVTSMDKPSVRLAIRNFRARAMEIGKQAVPDKARTDQNKER